MVTATGDVIWQTRVGAEVARENGRGFRSVILILTFLCCSLAPAGALAGEGAGSSEAEEADRSRLVELAEGYLQAVATGNTEFLERHLYQEGRFVYIEDAEEGPFISWSSASRLMDAVPQWKAKILERIWDPTVLVDGRIGLVWARYDFHEEGRFSHCGTNLFTFMKLEDHWVMTSGSWSAERGLCGESPLGPPPGTAEEDPGSGESGGKENERE